MSTVIIALICGIWYFLSDLDFGYTISETIGQPVIIGPILGILMGDPEKGLLLGGTLELIYLGIIYPGGTVPADCSSAALIAIPIALSTGMSVESAVVLAVPFGLLGGLVYNLKYTVNSFFLHKADAFASKGNAKGLTRCATIYPIIFTFLITFPEIFIANLVGPEAISGLLGSIPEWAMHGIEVAGGVLPAIGFAIAVITIGKKELMAFFIVGYFAVVYFELSIMGVAIFAVSIAMLLYYLNKDKQESEA
ncbi:MAG: PTS sugar transporter subunit IIC [Erysipelotrichaceae bacterium]